MKVFTELNMLPSSSPDNAGYILLNNSELAGDRSLGHAFTVKPSYFKNVNCFQFGVTAMLALKQGVWSPQYSRPAIAFAASAVVHIFKVISLGSLSKMARIKACWIIARMKNEQVSVDSPIGELECEPRNTPCRSFKEYASIARVVLFERPRKAIVGFVSLNHRQERLPFWRLAAPCSVFTHGAIIA